MTWLLDFFGSGKIALVVAAAVAVIGFLWRLLAGAKKAGRDEQVAKETLARERARELELQRIKAAADAAARVHPDDSLHNDPFNRDNRRT